MFLFSLCPLAITRDLVFSLVSGIINKVPSFTYFDMKMLLYAFGDFIPTTRKLAIGGRCF